MQKKNRLFSMSAALLCTLITAMLFMPARAAAAGVDDNSLTIHFKAEDNAMAGVEFKLYYVASINKQALTVSPVAPFDGYNVLYGSAEWRVKASTLAGYVSRDSLEPDASALTDENGRVRFTGLKDGMYLIVGQSKKAGSYTYTPVPSLIFLPNTSDYYNWQDDVTIEAKFTRRGGGSDPPGAISACSRFGMTTAMRMKGPRA